MVPRPDGEDNFDFYRCSDCRALITRVQELEGIKRGKVCPCGSRRYQPANPHWYEYLLPRVFRFAVLRIQGKA